MLRIRQAVRAILTTPDDAVLLVRIEFPTETVWVLPGGGHDPGEDHLTALHRELHEEVGLIDVDIGPHVWTREQIVEFVDGDYDGQRDQYHHVPVAERFDPAPAMSWEQLRSERMHEIRWWTIEQIDAATSSGVRFAPRRLGELVRRLAGDGPPTQPSDTGV